MNKYCDIYMLYFAISWCHIVELSYLESFLLAEGARQSKQWYVDFNNDL